MRRTFGFWVAVAGLLALLACDGEIDTDGGAEAPTGDPATTGDETPGDPSAPGDPSDPSAPGDPAPPPDPGPAGDSLSDREIELFELINEERAALGLGAVTLRATLNCAAARHSDDIGESRECTHTGSDGSSPGGRVDDCGGGGWSGEIVACGQGTPRGAVDAWIKSPGHNEIMFTPGQKEIGVAVHENFWTAIFDR